MNKRTKLEKGITLIALIITIIVLLILAGVSIASLTGENGLLNKAETSKETTERTELIEQMQLGILDVQSGKQSGSLTQDELKTILIKYVENEETDIKYDEKNTSKIVSIITKKGNYEIAISEIWSGNILIESQVMKQAKAAMPEGSSIKEGTTEETGIVMIDSNGNEWVWIEVPESVFTTVTSVTDYENIKADLRSYASSYMYYGSSGQQTVSPPYNWQDTYYSGCGIASEDDYNTLYNTMLSSIYNNKGFYVSRYEIGDKESTINNTTRTSDTGVANTPVSKVDQIPYNYVTCSDAQTLASSMATGDKTSSLMFGMQWGLVCKFLEINGDWDTTTNTAKYFVHENSTSWGNYKNSSLILKSGKYLVNGNSSNVWTAYNVDTTNYVTNSATSSSTSYYQLLTTGASEQINKMNIYDFAGNVWEWTLQKTSYTYYPCANRGGSYMKSGDSRPATSAWRDDSTCQQRY